MKILAVVLLFLVYGGVLDRADRRVGLTRNWPAFIATVVGSFAFAAAGLALFLESAS